MNIVQKALESARHELTTLHGLLATDGAMPEVQWRVDVSEPLALIDQALSENTSDPMDDGLRSLEWRFVWHGSGGKADSGMGVLRRGGRIVENHTNGRELLYVGENKSDLDDADLLIAKHNTDLFFVAQSKQAEIDALKAAQTWQPISNYHYRHEVLMRDSAGRIMSCEWCDELNVIGVMDGDFYPMYKFKPVEWMEIQAPETAK